MRQYAPIQTNSTDISNLLYPLGDLSEGGKRSLTKSVTLLPQDQTRTILPLDGNILRILMPIRKEIIEEANIPDQILLLHLGDVEYEYGSRECYYVLKALDIRQRIFPNNIIKIGRALITDKDKMRDVSHKQETFTPKEKGEDTIHRHYFKNMPAAVSRTGETTHLKFHLGKEVDGPFIIRFVCGSKNPTYVVNATPDRLSQSLGWAIESTTQTRIVV